MPVGVVSGSDLRIVRQTLTAPQAGRGLASGWRFAFAVVGSGAYVRTAEDAG